MARRTITYYRAKWPNYQNSKSTFQEIIQACLDHFQNVLDTRRDLGRNKLSEIRHRRTNTKNSYLHVAFWTDGEEISTVPHAQTTATEANLDVNPPGKTWDYLDGDGMLRIYDNHCFVLLSGNITLSNLRRYLKKLLQYAREKDVRLPTGSKIPAEIENFEFLAVANQKQLKKVLRKGLKKVNLNVGHYDETTQELSQPSFLKTLRKFILEPFAMNQVEGSEGFARRMYRAANLSVRLSLSIDEKGIQKGSVTSADLQTMIARSIEEDLEELVLVTKDNETVKHGQLILKESVDIPGQGKTVEHDTAWGAIDKFFTVLVKRSALDQ